MGQHKYTNKKARQLWHRICNPSLGAQTFGLIYVVLDNASFHKSKRTKELIESVGCKVIFLPPYSPDLNPTVLRGERYIDKKEKIPLIFLLVVYAGKAKYTAPRNLWSLFEYPELAKKLLIEDHALVDLEAMSDDEIAKKKHLALFEYIMKHVQMRDMLKLWQNLFEKLPDAVIMDKEHGYFYISNLLWYIDGQLSEKN